MHLLFIVVGMISLTVLVTIGLVLLVRHVSKNHIGLYAGTDDVEGTYITLIGGTYAVLLAFMVVVSWNRFDQAGSLVSQEADALSNVYRLSNALPAQVRAHIQFDCRDYLTTITQDEWPAMAHDTTSQHAWAVVDDLWGEMNHLAAHGVSDPVLRDHITTQFIALTAHRRERLFIAQSDIPQLLWTTLFIGGIVTVLFSAVFGVGGVTQHILKATVTAALIAIVLFTIWELANPYNGDVSVSTSAFQQTLAVFQQTRRTPD